jgi:mono/diheme cytochrome c family protein
MKRGTGIIVAIVLLAGIAAAVVVSLVHDGLSARAKPSALEAAIAGVMRRIAMPRAMRDTKNPVASSPDAVRAGMLHFADHCAVCHGNDGSGDTMMGRGMYPKPPDLRAEETQKKTDGEIFWIIENGVRLTGMPGFGGEGGEHVGTEDSWKLVYFIRHLPALTPEERMEMERYNPKGPDDRKEEQDEQDFLNGAPAKSEPGMEHHHH